MIVAMVTQGKSDPKLRVWIARILVSAVFTANLSAAIPFVVDPVRFTAGFELSGIPGEVSVRGLGIAFLMWNATYIPLLYHPERYRIVFTIVLAQQVIGLLGESLMLFMLPDGHGSLRSTGMRFIVFDGLGFVLLFLAFLISANRRQKE
jgi:hypothetical protein